MAATGENLVSWSKTGLIAYADSTSQDGNLCITFLETINGTNWRFHPPKRYIIHPHLHESPSSETPGNVNGSNKRNSIGPVGTPNVGIPNVSKTTNYFFYDIKSVYWNNWFNLPGDMLAVCDELGNMTMLILGQSPNGPVTMDKLTMLFQDNVYKIHNKLIQLDESVNSVLKIEKKRTKKEYQTAISDFFWLSSSKAVISSQFCVLDSTINTYRNKVQQIPPYGVFHPPFMKYACLAIRKNGQIDFWYQFSNSKNHKKITLQLNNIQKNQSKELDWLEFSKITPINEEQYLLLSCYSKIANRLSFHKLHVNWNVNTTNHNQLNDPSLTISHIYEINLDRVDEEGKVLEFVNLQVLSKSPVEKDTAPEILLIYNVAGTNSSVVKRYRLNPIKLDPNYLLVLNPELTSLGEKALNPPQRYTLKFSGDLLFNQRIRQVSTEIIDGFITFYLQDGSIQTYNQSDWSLENERLQNQNRQGKFRDILTSVLSAGFTFPKLPTWSIVEWATVSPAMTGVIVKLVGKDEPKFLTVYQTDSSNEKNDSVNSTSFAFGFVAGIHRQLSAEDLSIACKTHLMNISKDNPERGKSFITSLISCIYSFFNITPDAPTEILDKMISSRPVQKAMLLQLELGSSFKNENIYEMARVVMSLRNVYFALNGVARNLQFAIEQLSGSNAAQLTNGKLFQTAFTKQDLVHSLIPIAKWIVKFVTCLVQDLLILINNPGINDSKLVYGVLGARIPRALILSILTEIKRVTQLITKFPENTFPVLNESSAFLKMILNESPVSFERFETFMIDINNKFSSLNEQEPSTKREPSLLVKAEIPPEYTKICDFILTCTKSTILSHIDPAFVYFTDTSGLGISKEELFDNSIIEILQPLEEGLVVDSSRLPEHFKGSKSFSKLNCDGISYDTFTKEELNNGTLKRCCRCGCITRAGYAISGDKTIIPTSIQTKRWPTMYARVCICSGYLYELEN
ncbi:hypothetical protein Kpol_1015p6 [Vanderwaltozyma polyspora DSM 70294]|uniref:Mediator of RNA polymerase II transcription subunit 16 n=1 Tax=Vanderwaltozyma polyspora (strain ATCC 22028 / DSM 70294 / BCRC 21397 / CBS 2163 / NBRC 10782 / NRRL Y-8283 / UCD 57-17) TaxID=436907 RepID=A7TQN6_VANPO|nr:uncharacterized protein Kpol_1015p6 [Vanderwaltozyma polyspora DSM 70294]EDO15417.1 hypothetical protein Kpol_1015p6 [Vanderwaltozyma polyspora DSM 70294]